MVFSAKKLSGLEEESDLFDVMGWPYAEDLIRLDGKPLDKGVPREMVEAADWETWKEEDSEDLRILDFGESFCQDVHHAKPAMPGHLRVPELIFTGQIDNRADLWHAGLLVRHPYSPDLPSLR